MIRHCLFFPLVVVQLLNHVWLFTTPWTAAHQASLFLTNSWSSLKFISIALVMSSSHLILCCTFSFCPLSLPESGSLPVSQFFTSGGQSIGALALASVLLMNIQSWFPIGLTGLISLLFKLLSKVFSSTTVWKHQFFSTLLSLWSPSHTCIWLLERP